MSGKKIYSRKEFEALRMESAKAMSVDTALYDAALSVLIRADEYSWIHQTNWMGEPILNLPQDMFAIQDVIFQTRPKYIVECGVAWGGSLLFFATLLEILGGAGVIGIDTFVPDDLRQRLESHEKLWKRMTLIQGSSIDEDILEQLRQILGDCREVLVVLDSFHTHEHVLRELKLFSTLVGKGHYIVCGDTVIEDIPEQVHRPRPWGHGNNPSTAVKQFLLENDRFQVDNVLENKLLLTCNPGGFLKCMKD